MQLAISRGQKAASFFAQVNDRRNKGSSRLEQTPLTPHYELVEILPSGEGYWLQLEGTGFSPYINTAKSEGL
jgi:hypothetical protein